MPRNRRPGPVRFNPQAAMRRLITFLERQTLLPVVVFAFSKKKCQQFADSMRGVDMTTNQEKSDTHRFIQAAISRLQGTDRTLPQVTRVAELVSRGIGVHHSGMLPILKEVVEMLFSRGSVKVLFATETFAMGVNMPARTVVFEGLVKHDGQQRRELTSGEYTQMAGRAGRRGLDGFGIVAIFCHDDIPSELTCKRLITGQTIKLSSRFRLTYNMILNVLRLEDLGMEDMIKCSFLEAWSRRSAPEQEDLRRKIQRKIRELPSIECSNEPLARIEEYYHTYAQNARILAGKTASAIKNPDKFLPPGRVLLLKKFGLRGLLGCVLDNSTLKGSTMALDHQDPRRSFFGMLVMQSEHVPKTVRGLAEAKESGVTLGEASNTVYVLLPLLESDVMSVGKDRLPLTADQLIDIKDRKPKVIIKLATGLVDLNAKYRATEGTVTIHLGSQHKGILEDRFPAEDIPAEDDLAAADNLIIFKRNTQALAANPCHQCSDRESHLSILEKRSNLENALGKLEFALSDKNVSLIKEFDRRLNVLMQLQYIGSDRAVQVKGRAACEVNACDSLIVTELIFENVLTSLTPAEMVSLLSCLVFQQKNAEEVVLTPSLRNALSRLQGIALSLGNLQLKHGVDVVPSDYVTESVNPGLMQVVYEWAQGTSFAAICDNTEVEEGSIVRAITRLEEACREVRNAARVIGNPKLFQDMTEASELIKRDIVFAGSLYLS